MGGKSLQAKKIKKGDSKYYVNTWRKIILGGTKEPTVAGAEQRVGRKRWEIMRSER